MGARKLSRREFLLVGTLGVAGGGLGLTAVGRSLLEIYRSAGNDRFIDPAPGGDFAEPALLDLRRIAPGVLEGALSVGLADVPVAGTPARLMTYNGLFPGPLIVVKRGDLLHLTLANELPPSSGVNLLGHRRDMTNLHTHGWHVSPRDPADNSLLRIPAGESWRYSFDLSRQAGGTFAWYHPHVHGLVAEQLWQGLAGPLLVEDPSPLLSGFETHVMVIKDLALSDGAPTPYTSLMDYMAGKQGPIVTVNGLVNPELAMRPGQVQRWRIVNASTSRFYPLRLEDHVLQIIGSDGGLLDRPYPQRTLLLAPGERADVLVQARAGSGRHRLLALEYSSGSMMGGMMGGGDGGMMGGGMMGARTRPQTTLLTAVIGGRPISDGIPTAISQAKRPVVDLGRLVRRRFVLDMGMGRAFINGQDFDTSPYVAASRVPSAGEAYEIWTIINRSGMDHPWHQHVNHALPLAFEGGDAAYAGLYTLAPSWKDTVVVPRNGSLTMLMRISDWAGPTLYHCHIVEHEDIGMMGEWRLDEVA